MYALGGLIFVVQPLRQIVLDRLSGVTFGLIEPGVRRGSGRPTGFRVGDGDSAFDVEGDAVEGVGRLARGPGSQMITTIAAMRRPAKTPPIAAQSVRDTD